VAREVEDPERLVAELEKRHPTEAWGHEFGKTFLDLVEARGRDVVPYLMKHLDNVWAYGYSGKKPPPLQEHARRQGWWDVWSVLVRKGDNGAYNKEVLALCEDRSQPEELVFRRLVLLSGASGEWNWGRFAWQQVQYLKDRTALALYGRFPDLVRGPFRPHLALTGWGADGLPKFTAEVLRRDDHDLIDHLASQSLLVGRFPYYDKRDDKWVGTFLRYYEPLRSDLVAFARRVASVLGRLPARSIGRGGKRLLEKNALARLFFAESAPALLQDPRSVRDLLEATEIQAQVLALRALGQDDDRARELAAASLDLLPATLLRPLYRKTRLEAFRALANAATTEANARRVLAAARQALALPDERYPKEALMTLIAELCQRWPALRRAQEQPVVYRGRAKQRAWA
jgi:hypothetical protein